MAGGNLLYHRERSGAPNGGDGGRYPVPASIIGHNGDGHGHF